MLRVPVGLPALAVAHDIMAPAIPQVRSAPTSLPYIALTPYHGPARAQCLALLDIDKCAGADLEATQIVGVEAAAHAKCELRYKSSLGQA